ncbi:hypothetical protein L3X38_018386 [Prunus dulcis]|uniref:Uncharacterized protein n=1 Tax=Prunus dulcis TaxID=3755 RepID=A0AAD4ZB27_PRUDU|nr:hypothetical protein L3X38_018386 [Prunus dulcis]
MVDSTVGGSLMDKTANEAITAFETICENSKHWDFPTKVSRVAPTSSTQKGSMKLVPARYPRGIVEDVLIHVDQLILLADFIVLDMEEAEISGRELPLILGRPFMATASMKIDVKSILLTMNLQDTTINVQVFEALKRPWDPYDCFHVEVVDQIIEKTFIESSHTDPIENIDTLTAQTKTIEVMYLDDPPDI